MRRLLVAVTLLALGLPAHGASLQIIRREAAAASCTNTSITFWWRAENSTTLDGSLDFSAGDTTASANGSPTFDASAAKNGSYGVLVDAASERYVFTPSSNDIISGSAGRMGAWVKCVGPTFPGDASTGPGIIGERATATGNPRIDIRFDDTTVTNSFRLNWYDGTSNVNLYSATDSVTCGTWYFVEASWDAATDTATLYVNGTQVATTSATSMNAFTADGSGTSTGFMVGDRSGSSVGSGYYVDHIIVTSDTTKSLYDCANTASYP